MRFERIRIDAFGGLSDFDTGDDPLGRLVVVEGRNEAGKSTFFEWVATLLYGFSPASRETHPYAPWNGATAEGTGWLRTSAGDGLEIHRRLLSSPAATLTVRQTAEDLRNRPLPQADHLPANVYRRVFALRLAELAALEGTGWESVQDRLLGAFGANDIRSAREVADALETEAGRLWRPNRKGNQRIRDLEERRAELRMRRSAATREERAIRDATDALDEARSRLEAARAERMNARAFVERYRALLPIREQLARIEGLREDAGDPEALEALPSEPRRALEERRRRAEELHRRIRGLERDLAHPTEAIRAYDVHARTILAREPDLQAFLRHASAAEQTRLRKAQLEQDRRDIRRRLETGVLNALGRPYDEELGPRLGALPVPKLRDAMQRRLEVAQPGADEVEPHEDTMVEELRSLPPLTLGLLFGGLILAIVAAVLDLGTWLVMPGALMAGIGIAGFVSRHRELAQDAERRAAIEAARTAAREARRKREAKLAEVDDELQRLLDPLIENYSPADLFTELPSELARFQEWLQDDWDRREEIETLSRELDRLADEARELSALDEVLPADPAGLAHDLPAIIRAATARREAETAARRELARLEEQLEAARTELSSAEEELRDLVGRLREFGEGDELAGLEVVEARLRARDRANQLMDELERAHPDLEEIVARIEAAESSGEDWAVDPEAVARHRALEESLSDEIEQLQGRVRALEKEVEHLGERVTIDELDGQLEELEDTRDRMVRRRDRLWVMSRILREAERELREEHQPALLRRAGGFLARLTDGRYDRLLLGGRDGRDFRVRGPGTPRPLEVEHPLSTGTREQIYLALRLAILDHLDRAGERLPLILDEIFVNWDPVRRRAGIELLDEVARDRQVFFLTCHPELADLIGEFASCRITLGEAEPAT